MRQRILAVVPSLGKVGAIVLALAVSVVYGFCISHYGAFPFHQLYSLHRALGGLTAVDTAAHERWAAQAAFVHHRDVVMVGDSLTEGAQWHEMFEHVQPATRATGGYTTEDILARTDSILAVRPSKVFIMLGANDLARGDEPAAIFTRYAKVVAAFQSSGARVYVQSTLPCYPGKRIRILREPCESFNAKAAALNGMLRSLPGVQFVNLWPALSDSQGLRHAFTTDGVHLTTAGYVAWRDALVPILEPDTVVARP